MSRFAQLILIIILTLYPLAIYFGIEYLSLGSILILLLVVAVLRVLLGGAKKAIGTKLTTLALAVVIAITWLKEDSNGLLWYPVLCNLILFSVFFYSLKQPQTIVERLARLREPNLPPEGVLYTRKVTKAWCLFLLFNGSVALATVLNGNLKIWTIFNGLISYVLIGIMMGGEWLLRRHVQSKV
ncbi:hypothetical protein ACCI51_02660 [Microbulbifer echini]|uniref:DNA gyrase subunit B n=1 Tax=Microbulbifer echini TaxID=1529067 RepID=A0ABV4NJH4_9GAMM|nr:hypothetical protein [uncultured Microbulbifer sp.]